MELGLKNKLALVSGSTAGIGLAIAEGLAREGAHVIVNGRTQERVDTAIAHIRKNYKNVDVSGIAADMGTALGAKKICEAHPHVDILINNVGIFEAKAFVDITDDDW